MLLSAWAKDDYSFRQITMNDGLAANAVRNIVQDKNGYIWFGTDMAFAVTTVGGCCHSVSPN